MACLHLSILGRAIKINCADLRLFSLLSANYAAFRGPAAHPDLEYQVDRDARGERFCISGPATETLTGSDSGEFLFLIEKVVTVALQELRRDLYFLHAASLQFAGRAVLLVAESGGGKSTTSWALLNHGLGYASDELAPIDPRSMEVYPYPHALCVKRDPPPPYGLPEAAIRTSRTTHVPVGALPGGVVSQPMRLDAIFFVDYRPATRAPALQPISTAQAGARLYANALNALSHPAAGFDLALEIAGASRCFQLATAQLEATSKTILSALVDRPGNG